MPSSNLTTWFIDNDKNYSLTAFNNIKMQLFRKAGSAVSSKARRIYRMPNNTAYSRYLISRKATYGKYTKTVIGIPIRIYQKLEIILIHLFSTRKNAATMIKEKFILRTTTVITYNNKNGTRKDEL